MLAKFGAALGLFVALSAVIALDLTLLPLGLLGLIAAFKLSRLGVLVEGEELVLQNLFYTKRLNLQASVLHQGDADMRVREASGIDEIPANFIPRAADDNNKYKAQVVKVTDTSVDETYVVDASFGLTPPKQAELFDSLNAALGAAKQLPGSTG